MPDVTFQGASGGSRVVLEVTAVLVLVAGVWVLTRKRGAGPLDGLPLAVDVRSEGASACVKFGDSWYCRPTLTKTEAKRRVECLRRKLWFSRKRSVPGVVRAFAEGKVC